MHQSTAIYRSILQLKLSSKSQWLLISTLILIATLGIVWEITQPVRPARAFRLSPPQVRLVQDPEQPNRLSGVLTLTNEINSKIFALNVRTGCKCTVIDKVPESIAPGERASIQVTVQDSQAPTHLILLDFQVEEGNASIPVSEITTLMSEADTLIDVSP